MSTRYFLEVMYDGSAFHGSQLQGDLSTVQLSINKALSTLLREPMDSFGASRTDEGVHALSNFYHFETERELPEHFRYKMNAILSPAISLVRIFQCLGQPVNARFDALSRKYRYRIYAVKNPFYLNRALYYPFPLDLDKLNITADLIKSYSQFESFSKRNTQSRTFNCEIFESYWEENGDQIHYVVRANRFLRGMVRGLVATQLKVARGKMSLEDFKNIVVAQDCTRAFFNVAGHGLYLEEIIYPEGVLQELDLS